MAVAWSTGGTFSTTGLAMSLLPCIRNVSVETTKRTYYSTGKYNACTYNHVAACGDESSTTPYHTAAKGLNTSRRLTPLSPSTASPTKNANPQSAPPPPPTPSYSSIEKKKRISIPYNLPPCSPQPPTPDNEETHKTHERRHPPANQPINQTNDNSALKYCSDTQLRRCNTSHFCYTQKIESYGYSERHTATKTTQATVPQHNTAQALLPQTRAVLHLTTLFVRIHESGATVDVHPQCSKTQY